MGARQRFQDARGRARPPRRPAARLPARLAAGVVVLAQGDAAAGRRRLPRHGARPARARLERDARARLREGAVRGRPGHAARRTRAGAGRPPRPRLGRDGGLHGGDRSSRALLALPAMGIVPPFPSRYAERAPERMAALLPVPALRALDAGADAAVGAALARRAAERDPRRRRVRRVRPEALRRADGAAHAQRRDHDGLPVVPRARVLDDRRGTLVVEGAARADAARLRSGRPGSGVGVHRRLRALRGRHDVRGARRCRALRAGGGADGDRRAGRWRCSRPRARRRPCP